MKKQDSDALKTIAAFIALLFIYVYAQNNRYIALKDYNYVLDKYTKKVYSLNSNRVNEGKLYYLYKLSGQSFSEQNK